MNFIRTLFGKTQEDVNTQPSAETLANAKKIFFEYSCNGLYMAQNDVNFSQYHISKEQQSAWRNEFIAYWRSQLSTEDLTAIQKLRGANAVDAIPDLLAMMEQSILEHPILASESHKLETAKLGGADPKEYIALFAQKVVNIGR